MNPNPEENTNNEEVLNNEAPVESQPAVDTPSEGSEVEDSPEGAEPEGDTPSVEDEPAPVEGEEKMKAEETTKVYFQGCMVVGEPVERVINGKLCVDVKLVDTNGGEQTMTVLQEEYEAGITTVKPE